MTEDKKIVRLIRKSNMVENQMIYYFTEDFYVGGRQKPREKKYFFRLAIASFVMLFFDSFHGEVKWTMYQPYAILTFDVNPSLELYINSKQQIDYIEPLNEEGQKIVEGYNEKSRSLSEVLEYLTTSSVKLGYLVDQGTVLVSYGLFGEAEDTYTDKIDTTIDSYRKTL